jgi:peroxiredoxin Q/BCP
MPRLKIGDPAPPFSLTTEKGENVILSDVLAKGPVVLIFYPMDQTPGCTAQLCAVRNDAPRYAEAGVQVFGVNGGDANSHQRFVARYNLTAPLLVDKGLATAAAYDAVVNLGLIRIINRTVVGIGRDGKIVFFKRGSPSTDEILAAVGAAPV